MNLIARILILKIVLTLNLWCIPLMLFPGSWFVALGLPELSSYQFLRLLGMAYLSLCIGYAVGLRDALHGTYPQGCVWMGIFSNAGAAVVLLMHGLNGAWDNWGGMMQVLMGMSLFSTAAIAAGLAYTLKQRS